MSWVGFILIVSGVILVFGGVLILVLAAIALLRQMCATRAKVGVAPPIPGVNLADLAKLIEAIVKMPQWLLAVLAGDIQIWLGYLVDGHKWF